MNRYQFKDENGQHAHFLDGRPLVGTSSVLKVISKPLTYWASGCAVMEFGVPDPKVLTKIKNGKATKEEIAILTQSLASKLAEIQTDTLTRYQERVMTAYRAHDTQKKERAVTGVDTHALCEEWIRKCMLEGMGGKLDYDDIIEPFVSWAQDNVNDFYWAEGHCFSEKHWLGGISDTAVELKDGRRGILDFKSSREAYTEQFWQAGGYSIEIEENGVFDKDGNQLLPPQKPFDFVAILPFGAKNPQVQINTNIDWCKKGFLATLELYKLFPRE